jgi:hypothetical protein
VNRHWSGPKRSRHASAGARITRIGGATAERLAVVAFLLDKADDKAADERDGLLHALARQIARGDHVSVSESFPRANGPFVAGDRVSGLYEGQPFRGHTDDGVRLAGGTWSYRVLRDDGTEIVVDADRIGHVTDEQRYSPRGKYQPGDVAWYLDGRRVEVCGIVKPPPYQYLVRFDEVTLLHVAEDELTNIPPKFDPKRDHIVTGKDANGRPFRGPIVGCSFENGMWRYKIKVPDLERVVVSEVESGLTEEVDQ